LLLVLAAEPPMKRLTSGSPQSRRRLPILPTLIHRANVVLST
jgi:hypothetical protein